MAIYELNEIELSVEAGTQFEYFLEKNLSNSPKQNDCEMKRTLINQGSAEVLEGKALAISIDFDGKKHRLLIPREEWQVKRNIL